MPLRMAGVSGGFALQLCAFRFPGRLLRPREAIPPAALRVVAAQIGTGAEALADYARRPQTRREQLDGLRLAFGFRMFTPAHRRDIAAWLLPVTLATTSAPAVASTLLDELRRRRIPAPGPSVIERLVGTAMLQAERHVAGQLTRTLTMEQVASLDALLAPREGTPMSVLAWVRRPSGAPGRAALASLVEQIERLRVVGLDPACAEGVHPERLRQLAREGGRLTAQHLRALSPLRRRATMVATVLDTIVRLTDEGVGLFQRGMRPRMVKDQRYRSAYILGAVCPARDTGAAIVLTHVSVMAMNLLLEEVAAQLPPGTHAVMLIDNAGWHIANDLRVPPNISLVHLPPYSPELNAIERVWQYLRDRYLSGRLFGGTRAIVDACCEAWNNLMAETGRIRSLTDFEWARQVRP